MKAQKWASTFLTIFVIAVLLLAAPAEAIQLNITDLPTSAAQGLTVGFTLRTQIEAGENIPIDDVTLLIDGPSGLQTCVFEPDGTPVSGCEGIAVSLLEDSTDFLSSPDRFGNGFNGTDVTNTSFGYGYGFGNGPVQPTLLAWGVQWNTTGKSTGDYDVDFYLSSSGNSVARQYRLENPDTITLTGTASVKVDIKAPFPVGNSYVFICNASNFTPTSYDWNFGDGSKQYDKSVSDVYHTFGAPGNYEVTCVANDGSNNIAGTRVVTVGSGPAPNATTDLYVKKGFPVNDSFVLVCNTTVANAVYTYNFGDGQKLINITNNNTFHKYAPGQYNATCTASNGTTSSSDSLAINASFVPPPPGPTSSLSIKNGWPIGDAYILVCNSSIANARYDWKFGDGQKSLNITNSNVWHNYPAGSYNASCTAKNATASTTASLVVTS